jgi:hypothetical protein
MQDADSFKSAQTDPKFFIQSAYAVSWSWETDFCIFFNASLKSAIVIGTLIYSCIPAMLFMSKPVLANLRLSGIIEASLQTLLISAPE